VKSGLARKGEVIFREDGQPGAAIKAAIGLSPDAIIEEVAKANLRGRGGAGFPTATKWKSCHQSPGTHYLVCNADEGEPGTFKDRELLTVNPDLVFDGMTVGALAIGAEDGIIYLRGEYAYLMDRLQKVLERRRQENLLGKDVCGKSGFNFDIRIQLGAGAYICGEETALIESMEGKRGAPRDRPPFPVAYGYRGQPTAVDNVETLACVSRIMEYGAAWFASFGTKESSGTKLLSISGDCQKPGVYEIPFGTTLKDVLELVEAPDAAFVQVGGPSGSCVGPQDFGRQITAREDLTTGGSIIVFGPDRDPFFVAHEFLAFFVEESCGWCAPCRIGTTLLKRQFDKFIGGRGTRADLDALIKLANTVKRMSRCGLGQTAPNPILSSLKSFPEIFEAKLSKQAFIPEVTLYEALAEAVAVQGRLPTIETEEI
jgi:[NiFe] hydrogenase diaphorase moiety large subunit